jgi:hypothetical protein
LILLIALKDWQHAYNQSTGLVPLPQSLYTTFPVNCVLFTQYCTEQYMPQSYSNFCFVKVRKLNIDYDSFENEVLFIHFLTIHKCIYYFGHNIIFKLPLLRPHINWVVQRQRGPTALHIFVSRKRFNFNHEGKTVVKINGFVIYIWTGDLNSHLHTVHLNNYQSIFYRQMHNWIVLKNF